jgi:glycosyltransferase involved in cell wall biosynthesis
MTSTNAELRGTERLRVLTVTPRFLPLVGGTELHTYETARRIAAARQDVTILTINPGNQLAAEEWRDELHILRIAAWPVDRDINFAPALSGVIAQRRWDIVHCQGIHTLVAPVAMLAAWRAGIPYVVTFHSGGHSSRLRTLARGTQWSLLGPLLRRAARLIGVSEYEAQYFSKRLRLPAAKVEVIPNGVQLPETPSASTPPPSAPLIVSAGRLERYKGHHRVIAALPHVLARRPDARLRIIGSGPYEAELVRLARELGVAEHVEIGAIPGADRQQMAAALSQAAVVALLSDYESQGIAVWEAVQLQRPVLVSDSSALSELARRGLARAVAPRSSPPQIAAALLEQIEHPCIPASVPLPTWDDCAARLLTLYQSLGRAGSTSASHVDHLRRRSDPAPHRS